MQFFKHDTNMINDNKIQRLVMNYGAIAYAVYNVAIEKIGSAINENNQDCSLPAAAKIIAHELWESEETIKPILKEVISIGLLDGDADGTIYCTKILTRINISDVSNAKLRSAISNVKRELKEKNDKIIEKSQNHHENITKKDDDCHKIITIEKESETELEIESETNARKEKITEFAREIFGDSDSLSNDFTKQVFDVCTKIGMPNCDNNFISFIQRDFKLALSGIHELRLHSDELLAALENYGEVLKLKREGKTWWERDLRLDQLCNGQKKLVMNFLPDNFKIADYEKEKPAKGDGLPENRIRL